MLPNMIAYDFGKDCARKAVEAGGLDPYAWNGRTIFPKDPLKGDYEALSDHLERDPTQEEIKDFEYGYREEIRKYHKE